MEKIKRGEGGVLWNGVMPRALKQRNCSKGEVAMRVVRPGIEALTVHSTY